MQNMNTAIRLPYWWSCSRNLNLYTDLENAQLTADANVVPAVMPLNKKVYIILEIFGSG